MPDFEADSGEKSQEDSALAEVAAGDGQETGSPLAQFVDRGLARRLDPVIRSLNAQNERFAIGRLPSPEQSREFYFLKLPLVVELQTCFELAPESSALLRATLCYFHCFRFLALALLAGAAPAVAPGAFAAALAGTSLAKLCFSLRLRRLFRSSSFFLLEALLDAGLLAVALLAWLLVRRPCRLRGIMTD